MKVQNTVSHYHNIANIQWSDASQYNINAFQLNTNPGYSLVTMLPTPEVYLNNFDISEVVYNEIMEFYAGRWAYGTNHHELKRTTFTWRNIEGNLIYDFFRVSAETLYLEYPEDAYWTINIVDREGNILLDLKDAMLIGVSALAYGHDKGEEVQTFTTTFVHGN